MKRSLVITLTLMLVLAFATSAIAAQTFSVRDGYNFYNPTVKSFTYDSKTNYPYEIYLPNEDPGQYRIHSSYTKNTDACASCHATHTAVGNYLLQWYTAYDTCMACHDGTVSSTYDVVNGVVGNINGGTKNGAPTPGGAFGQGQEGSNSMHNVTGAVTITSAPGGSVVATQFDSNNKPTDWVQEFGCESCHSPHGAGGNARILHPNPNGAATALAKTNGWLTTGITANIIGIVAAGEKSFDGATIAGKVYFAAKPTAKAETLVYNVGAGYIFLKPGRESSFKVNGSELYNTSFGSEWIIDNQKGFTRAIYVGAGTTFTQVYGNAGNVKFQAVPVLKVVMDIDNYLNTGNKAEEVYHVSGLNNFCGACHTDYNTASMEVYYGVKADGTLNNKLGSAYQFLSGTYSKAHRHTVGTERTLTPITDILDYEWAKGKADYNNRLATSGAKKGVFTCLTCHVAHGVNEAYWSKTLVGKNGWTQAMIDEGELAGSSVLKRQPNMGTCETCHAKGTANEGYAVNANGGAVVPVEEYPTVDNLVNQKNASYIGSNNRIAPCGQCHREAAEVFINTQHAYLVSPLDADKYFKEFAEDGKGNATKEALAALQTFEDEVYPLIVAGLPSREDDPSQPLTAAVLASKANVLSAGQLPVGKKTEAAREVIVKTYDSAAGINKYSVVATVDYVNGAWKVEAWELDRTSNKIKVSDNYTGCYMCHSVAKNDTAGTKAPSRALLDGWTAYFAGTTTAKPAADLSLSCEACHGEASNHVKQPMTTNIWNPAKADNKAQSRVCGRCHTGGGDKGYFTAYYSPWKLTDTTAVTPGNVVGTEFGTVTSVAYTTVATRLDAFFKAYYDFPSTLPSPVLNSDSVSEWTYFTAEGRQWQGPSHSQYVQFTISDHWNNPYDKLSCSSCHDAHSEEISANQLKITEAVLCQTCHGINLTPAKYMPTVYNSGVRYHDFGKVIDPVTKKFINTKTASSKQPKY